MNQKNGKITQVIWSEFAIEMLRQIYDYYQETANQKVAQELISTIFSTTKQLENYPHSGQIEENLAELSEDHKYLVSGNYKIIYKEVKEGVLVTDIFDTRQDPSKMQG